MRLIFIIGIALSFCSTSVYGQDVLRVKYVRENGENFDPSKVLSSIPDKLTGLTDEILGALERKHYSMLVSTSEHSFYVNLSNEASFGDNVKVDADTTEAVYYKFDTKEILQNKPKNSGPLRLTGCDFSHSYRLTNITNTIMGYTCVEAEIAYCGNDYLVYFTPELPFPTGPRAFVGLPGLILAVSNAEKTWSVKAVEVEMDSEYSAGRINVKRLKELMPVAKEVTMKEYCEGKKKQ